MHQNTSNFYLAGVGVGTAWTANSTTNIMTIHTGLDMNSANITSVGTITTANLAAATTLNVLTNSVNRLAINNAGQYTFNTGGAILDGAMYVFGGTVSTSTSDCYGGYFITKLNRSSGTATTGAGVYILADFSSNVGTITNGYGLQIDTGSAGGTITNGYGLRIANPAFGATNKYGLYIDSISGAATLNYGAYIVGRTYTDTALIGTTFSTGSTMTVFSNLHISSNASATPTAGLLKFGSSGSANYIQSGLSTTTTSSAPLYITNCNDTTWAWFNTNGNLNLGTSTTDVAGSASKLHVNGILNISSNVGPTTRAGICGEASSEIINIGINEDSVNRFGGAYDSSKQGGMLRIDMRTGQTLFNFLARNAASSSGVANVVNISSSGVMTLQPGTANADARIVIRSGGAGFATAMTMGRTSDEMIFGISGGANNIFTGSIAGDICLRNTNASGKIMFGNGSDSVGIIMNGSRQVTIGSTDLAGSAGQNFYVSGSAYISQSLLIQAVPAGVGTRLSVRSGNALNNTSIGVGRIANDGLFGVAGGDNDFLSGSISGDLCIVQSNAGNKTLIGTTGNAPLIIYSNGEVGFGNRISVRSGNALNNTSIGVGRIANDGLFGVAGGGNDFLSGSISGDLCIVQSNAGNKTLIGTTGNAPLIIYSNGEVGFGNRIYPALDNTYTCGVSEFRWSVIWAGSGSINTSDETAKKEIFDSDLGLEFINKIRPVRYKLIDNTSGRQHYGLLAQQVKSVMDEFKITTKDFAAYIDPAEVGEKGFRGLRYGEFICPIIKAVQELTNTINVMQSKITMLEQSLISP